MWHVRDSLARLSSGPLTGVVDLSRPQLGISGINSPSSAVRQILGVWFDEQAAAGQPQLIEAHVRSADLIARYAEDERRCVRPEVYWRAFDQSNHGTFGIELIVSVQSSQLSSQPRLATKSWISVSEALLVGLSGESASRVIDFKSADAVQLNRAADFFLFRLGDAALSYCEMVQPSDFVRSTARPAEQPHLIEISHELFPNSLEKGVIRRGRARGVFVPRERDVEHASKHFAAFAASKPVLSA